MLHVLAFLGAKNKQKKQLFHNNKKLDASTTPIKKPSQGKKLRQLCCCVKLKNKLRVCEKKARQKEEERKRCV